jgi:subtilisin family serine protease
MGTRTTYKQLTLAELAKRKDPDGNLAVIAEVLEEDNEILLDAPWLEANDTFSHMITRRLNLPAGTWRKLNKGVDIESSQTVNVRETIGMLETYSEADKDLVDAAPNPKAFRMSEATAFLEGLSQTFAEALIYGNATTTPEKFTGLAPRLAATSMTNVYDAGGSGSDTTSIFIVQWGPSKVHLVYPKGSSSAGIMHEDLGQQTVSSATSAVASSAQYEAYRDHFQIKVGLAVRDDASIGRIVNIETTGTSNIFNPDDLIKLLNRMPARGKGAVIYCNHVIYSQMDIQAMDKSNVLYSTENVFGVPTVHFRGFPVRKVDQILSTETAI